MTDIDELIKRLCDKSLVIMHPERERIAAALETLRAERDELRGIEKMLMVKYESALGDVARLRAELEEARNELERFYAIANTMRQTSINSESPEKRMWMKIAADALDAQRQQVDESPNLHKNPVDENADLHKDGQQQVTGYCADCNCWGGAHSDGCQKRPERFFRPG